MSTDAPTVGTRLHPITRVLTPATLVAYAGATWDWHRMHHDQEFATSNGLPGPIVDGQMLGALLAEQLMDEFGPSAWIRAMSFRFQSMVYAGQTVIVTGEITGVTATPAGAVVSVRQQVTSGEHTALGPASAEVIINA